MELFNDDERKVIEIFLKSFESKRTRNSYRHSIHKFKKYINKSLYEVKVIDLLDFHSYLDTSEYALKTTRLYFGGIKSFYDYIYREKQYGRDYGFDTVPRIDFKLKWRRSKDIPGEGDILTIDEIVLVLAELKKGNFKHYLVFYILSDTSMRQTGLVNIMLENVDLDNRKIKTFDKGRWRLYTFGKNLKDEIEKYLVFRMMKRPESKYLFFNRESNQETARNIYRLFRNRIRKTLKKLNIDKKISGHDLRSSFKTNRSYKGERRDKTEYFMQHGWDYTEAYRKYTNRQRLELFDKFEFL